MVSSTQNTPNTFSTLNMIVIERIIDVLTGPCSLNHRLKTIGVRGSLESLSERVMETWKLCDIISVSDGCSLKVELNFNVKFHPEHVLGYMNNTNRYWIMWAHDKPIRWSWYRDEAMSHPLYSLIITYTANDTIEFLHYWTKEFALCLMEL